MIRGKILGLRCIWKLTLFTFNACRFTASPGATGTTEGWWQDTRETTAYLQKKGKMQWTPGYYWVCVGVGGGADLVIDAMGLGHRTGRGKPWLSWKGREGGVLGKSEGAQGWVVVSFPGLPQVARALYLFLVKTFADVRFGTCTTGGGLRKAEEQLATTEYLWLQMTVPDLYDVFKTFALGWPLARLLGSLQ